jgi:hypothetical protein
LETIDITEPINITNNSNGNNTNKKTEELDKILNDLKTKKNIKTIPKNQVYNLLEEDYKVAEVVVPEIRKASERQITSNGQDNSIIEELDISDYRRVVENDLKKFNFSTTMSISDYRIVVENDMKKFNDSLEKL